MCSKEKLLLGLESVKDGAGNIIREAALPVWANLRQRALNTAIREINKKTDLNIALESLERSRHRRVTALTFAIGTQAVPNSDSKGKYVSSSTRFRYMDLFQV
jgi:Initiator Replication protein